MYKRQVCNGAKGSGFYFIKLNINLFSICVASPMLNKIVVEQRNTDVKFERSWDNGMQCVFDNAVQFQELQCCVAVSYTHL